MARRSFDRSFFNLFLHGPLDSKSDFAPRSYQRQLTAVYLATGGSSLRYAIFDETRSNPVTFVPHQLRLDKIVESVGFHRGGSSNALRTRFL